jgi:hypothetical protein
MISEAVDVRMVDLGNGISVGLVTIGEQFGGIGEVRAEGVLLRSPDERIMPEIATPDGFEMAACEVLEVRAEGDAFIVETRPSFRIAHRMEWSEHAMHQRVNTASWSSLHTDERWRLRWVIRPATESLGGVSYAGFSYGFEYACPGMEIYQIEDKATRELGGNAEGNTFVMRGAFAPALVDIAPETEYCSAWHMPGIANPYIFQHLPLYAQLQGFTFQFDDARALVTKHEQASHVRSLFKRSPGSKALLQFNQFCFDLTDTVATPPRRILTAVRTSTGRTDTLNHFLRVRDQLQADVRAQYGISLDTARPTCHVETWGIASVDVFPAIWDALAEWGFKRTFLMPFWRSAETDIVPRIAEDRERFGVVGNMCCPLELEIAECYGGWDGLRRILERAVDQGIETYMWFGSHFSSFATEHVSRFFARDQAGQWQRNNYGHVLCAVDQTNAEYQEYLVNAYRRAGACGLRGVFRDSHFNMAADTIAYRYVSAGGATSGGATADQIGFIQHRSDADTPDIHSMHDAEAAIQRRFQTELGMLYYVESAGVMGTPMTGTNYDWVRGNEFLFTDMDTGINTEKLAAHGDTADMAYFGALSVRLFYQVQVEVNQFPEAGAVSDWWNAETMSPLVKAFNVVEPYLKQLWLLDDDRGVRWTDGQREAVFAYKQFTYALDAPASVRDVLAGEATSADASFSARPMGIYVVEPVAEPAPRRETSCGRASRRPSSARSRRTRSRSNTRSSAWTSTTRRS